METVMSEMHKQINLKRQMTKDKTKSVTVPDKPLNVFTTLSFFMESSALHYAGFTDTLNSTIPIPKKDGSAGLS